jgi:hypothetical protein
MSDFIEEVNGQEESEEEKSNDNESNNSDDHSAFMRMLQRELQERVPRQHRQALEQTPPRVRNHRALFGPNFRQRFIGSHDPNSLSSEENQREASSNGNNFTIFRGTDQDGNNRIAVFRNRGGLGTPMRFDSSPLLQMDRAHEPIFNNIFQNFLQRLNMSSENQNQQQQPATKEMINQLRETKINSDNYEKDVKGEVVPPSCPICTDTMESTAVILP